MIETIYRIPKGAGYGLSNCLIKKDCDGFHCVWVIKQNENQKEWDSVNNVQRGFIDGLEYANLLIIYG